MAASPHSASRDRSGPPLDDLALAIIDQLRQDGRRPYAAIGKAVGLSEAAVRQRVQRLTESGVIQIVAVTDPYQMGLSRQVTVGVTVDGALDPVATALAEIPEAHRVVITTGGFDILVDLFAEDDDHLLSLLTGIRSLDGVHRSQTLTHLRLKKQGGSWQTT